MTLKKFRSLFSPSKLKQPKWKPEKLSLFDNFFTNQTGHKAKISHFPLLSNSNPQKISDDEEEKHQNNQNLKQDTYKSQSNLQIERIFLEKIFFSPIKYDTAKIQEKP